ncbi:MAG: hypothetical protein KF696_05215 [Planctomycetes bacterium]|nr:hypothetical protein [Planctomycetota bacterium]MCW8136285.1 hypothetical protein [Planctomycetota bacterium]
MRRLFVLLALAAAITAPHFHAHAQKLKGDEAKVAKERLREVKKDWKGASKADKYRLIQILARQPENTVTKFLLEVVDGDADDAVASWAARAVVNHGDASDHKELLKSFNKAKTPERRAACVRWLGGYGEATPFKQLEKLTLEDEASAEAAVHACADAKCDAGWAVVDMAAQKARHAGARSTACARLLSAGDKRGIAGIAATANVEDAARAAHAAIGGPLEVDAVKAVLEHAKKTRSVKARPHFFGSLLARLTHADAHTAVASDAAALNRVFDVEIGWWLVSVSRAQARLAGVTRWLEDEDREKVLHGLRSLQRLPKPFTGDELKAASDALIPKLASGDDEIAGHALLACITTGACPEIAAAKVAQWISSEKPEHLAAALLAGGKLGLKDHAPRAVALLEDTRWWVVSAALDYLLHVRPADCLKPVFELAKRTDEGRLFAEAIALLCDLTGSDHGDLVNKWEELVGGNPPLQARKLESLRGVPYKKLRSKTTARFYGLEIDSNNLQFAIDRSVSMIMPVTMEPERQDFPDRKADILKRRPEVNRHVRDGYLPRFYVAAAEVHACADNMSPSSRIGITAFNTEQLHSQRIVNSIDERRKLVNWMLSTDPQGGTDIKAALLAIIEKAEADTIVLLSDGEPTSIGILEEVHRVNAFKRLNIHAVSLHEQEYYRHYQQALANREHGQIIDAEPQ